MLIPLMMHCHKQSIQWFDERFHNALKFLVLFGAILLQFPNIIHEPGPLMSEVKALFDKKLAKR